MTKPRIYCFLALVLLAIAHPGTLLAEGLALFADKALADLTLVATNPKAGTFRVTDSSGYAQDGGLNDLIGMDGAKVTEIRETAIVVAAEEEYDWYGTTRTRSLAQIIPLARALTGGKGVQ